MSRGWRIFFAGVGVGVSVMAFRALASPQASEAFLIGLALSGSVMAIGFLCQLLTEAAK